VEASPDSLTKRDVDAVELLNKVKLTKENWIDAGKRPELCAQPWLSHNVSNTISVKDSEWAGVEEYIYANREAFAGISLLPDGGDLDYPQAPFCEVLTADEIVATYGVGALLASGLIVDGLHAFDDNLWAACDCALGRGEKLESPTPKVYPKRVYEAVEVVRESKLDWVRRARKFARNYFDNDVLKMTRCLKRVNACKQWEDLTRTYAPVDYTLLVERQDNTTVTQTVACAGGKCELI
jgi:ribonucleoside-diphosphate reductase alpha chain